MTTYATPAELEAGLDHLRAAPRGEGLVEMIVRRPVVVELRLVEGLVGDSWRARGRSGGRPANEKAQITVMNARSTALVAGDRERWPLAGDQLFVDFDLSGEHIPPGTRLAVGTAVIEVTDDPHTGCKKFSARFGLEALLFVNSPEGKALNLRGINTRVVEAGTVRVGDAIRRL